MKSIANWFRHAWIVLLVAGSVILLDQWSKSIVRVTLPRMQTVPVLGEWFMWQRVDNYGASFGMFQNAGLIFAVVAIAVSIGILVYVRYVPTDRKVLLVLLGLQLGGAVGNLIDRVQQGYVTDFAKMGIPGVYYWPNYNVADAAIVTGVVGLAIYVIWEDVTTSRRAKHKDGAPVEE